MRQCPTTRAGYTLTELMLVLALMVAVAALVAPNYQRALPTHRLRKSGDIMREAWTRARLLAMKSGKTQVFKFEINGRQYKIQPWYGANDYLEADLQTASMQGGGTGAAGAGGVTGAPTGQAAAPAKPKKLPEGVVFRSIEGTMENREAQQQAQNAGVVDPDANSGVQWSRPVVFYPDGTTSDSQITINNKENAAITVRIRGLTGAIQVSDLMDANAVPGFVE